MVEAGAGDLITVNPGEVHDGAPIGESRAWAMLYFPPEKIGAMALDIRGGKSANFEFDSPVIHERATAHSFAKAYAALKQGDNEAADEQLMLLVAALLHDVPEEQAAASVLRHSKARIDDDPAGHHPLEELAENAGISRFQMIRGFARMTGLTPRAYVVQSRIDLARSMIRKGAALADAAISAGFSDQSHFHRSFTLRYGLTPGAYAAVMR